MYSLKETCGEENGVRGHSNSKLMAHETMNWHASLRLSLLDRDEVRTVPDRTSRDLEVIVVRCTINLGTGNLEWGRNGEGLRKGRSVQE
jgi:hypothetical protein